MRANSIAILVFLLGAISAAIAVYAWRHRATRGSQLFSYFMVAVAVYVLGYGMELSSLDLPAMLFWSKIGYLGIFSFPTLFLMFTLQYTSQDKWLTRRNILFLFLVPTLLAIAKFTDDSFHLVYSTAWVETSGTIPLLGFTRGPIYGFALYSIFPIITGMVLLWRTRKNALPLYKNQATLLAVFAILPLLVFLFYMSGIQLTPDLKYIDLNPFMSTLWGIGILWAMFRYRLLDLAPIARDVLIESLDDGLFVFDDQIRLVDANPMALKIMDWIEAPLGQNVDQVFADWKDLRDECQAATRVEPVKIEIQKVVKGQRVFFETTLYALQDKKARNIGRFIVIHDITERKNLEESLRELSLVDDLTGLSNRRGFHVLATQIILMAKRMNLQAGFIFADMDKLKEINDTFGHAEGDKALVDLANILRSTFRSSDILARLGGDEFIVLSIESKDNLAEGMLARVRNRLEEFNQSGNRKYEISTSFGVAHYHPEYPL